jgi:hypothetical protein
MEDLKNKVNKLEEKLDQNVKDIINNMNKLHSHEEQINKNTQKIKKHSYALEILEDYKNDKKMLYRIVMILIFMWIITIGCLIFSIIK